MNVTREAIVELRIKVAGLLAKFKAIEDTAQINLDRKLVDKVEISFLEIRHHLGYCLKFLGNINPYAPAGTRKGVKDIEPTADLPKEEETPLLDLYINPDLLTTLLDELRDEVEVFIIEVLSNTHNKLPKLIVKNSNRLLRLHYENAYLSAVLAKTFIGEILGNIRDFTVIKDTFDSAPTPIPAEEPTLINKVPYRS
jgi:hypothetical protein